MVKSRASAKMNAPSRDAQQRGDHAARPVAIEQHAERQLERGEREQVHRGEEAEVRRARARIRPSGPSRSPR
jgi:hypothetical protein